MSTMARIVSLTVLTTLIVFLGITFFQVVAPFLLPLFLAAVLAVMCQPDYRRFLRWTKDRPRLAAGLTTASVLTLLLVPLVIGTWIASLQLVSLAQNTLGSASWNKARARVGEMIEIDRWAALLQSTGSDTSAQQPQPIESGEAEEGEVESSDDLSDAQPTKTETVGIADGESVADEEPDQAIPEESHALPGAFEDGLKTALHGLSQKTLGMAGAAAGAAPGVAIGFLGTAVSLVIGSLMFVIALYYFLADGPELLASAQRLIPVHVDYQQQLLTQFQRVVRAVIVATFLAAITQGLITAVLLALFGFGHFFVFFIVAMLASLIPLAGTWLVWGPCAVWLAYSGSWVSAFFLTLFGAVVVGSVDNVIRTYVLQSDAKLHPLLAFVSVLGGLQVMGLWGIFIGPIVASCLHALVEIFNTELSELSKQKFADREPEPLDEGDSSPPPVPVTAAETASVSEPSQEPTVSSVAQQTVSSVDDRAVDQSAPEEIAAAKKNVAENSDAAKKEKPRKNVAKKIASKKTSKKWAAKKKSRTKKRVVKKKPGSRTRKKK